MDNSKVISEAKYLESEEILPTLLSKILLIFILILVYLLSNKSKTMNYMPAKQVNACLAGLYLPCQLTAYSTTVFCCSAYCCTDWPVLTRQLSCNCRQFSPGSRQLDLFYSVCKPGIADNDTYIGYVKLTCYCCILNMFLCPHMLTVFHVKLAHTR